MKNLLLLASLFLMGMNVKSQELSIDWGNEFDSKTDVQKILGYSGDVLVDYSIKGKKRYIGLYHKDGFGLKSSSEFELPELEGEKSGMLNLALSGDHITSVLYVYHRKTKSFSLFAQKIDFDGKLKGEAKKVYSSDEGDERIKNRRVEAVFSPDKTMALVYFDRMDKKRTEFYSDMITLDLDNGAHEMSEIQETFKVRDSRSESADYVVYHSIENDGTYNLIKQKVEKNKGKVTDFTLLVSRYDETGQLIGEAEIKEEDKILQSPKMLVVDDKVIVVGYYRVPNKRGIFNLGYSGMFYSELNKEMELQATQLSKFSDEFFVNLYSQKKIDRMNKKEKEISVPAPYTMNDIFVHSDGSMTVLSEYYLQTVYSDRGKTTTTTNYASILFFKLNEGGEIVSSDAIKKNQMSSTTTISIGAFSGGLSFFISVELPDNKAKYWSYASSMKNDKIYLVFNDHFKNAQDGEDDLSKPMMNPKKSVPYLVTINTDGSFEKNAMVTSGDTETYTVPQVTYETDEDEFIIWGVWRKQNKFGVATID